MEPNFSALLEYWEDTASSSEPEDDAPPTCFYWPPGLLQTTIPEDTPLIREDTDEANCRLAYLRLIDCQRQQIRELEASSKRWQDITLSTSLKFVRFKRRCRAALQGAAALLLLIALLLWHEAIAAVGWNTLCCAAPFFGTGPEFLSGLIIAALLLRLMWAVAKSVFHAAMEDLCPQPDTGDAFTDEEDDFL